MVKVERDTFCIQTGDGILKIEEVQLEGKKRMDTAALSERISFIPGGEAGLMR